MIARFNTLFFVWCLWMAFGQTVPSNAVSAPKGGVASGTLRGEDGTVVSNVSLLLVRTTGSSRGPRQFAAVVDSMGGFSIEGLPDGIYTACIQFRQNDWLNPCVWGGRPVAEISSRQRISKLDIVLKRAAKLSIRVNDPNGLFLAPEAKSAGANLLIGVGGDNGMFFPAAVDSQDAVSRTYSVVVPFGRIIRLVLNSSYFKLTDASGGTVPTGATHLMQVAVPAGQVPPPVNLTIVGGAR